MRNRIIARIGRKICDIGLWVLSLGPKTEADRNAERLLFLYWKRFNARVENLNPPPSETL